MGDHGLEQPPRMRFRTLPVPIHLDDTVLHTPSGWAAQLRSRHMGDVRGWKDHDAYQVAFTRLLRDLKAKDEAGIDQIRA